MFRRLRKDRGTDEAADTAVEAGETPTAEIVDHADDPQTDAPAPPSSRDNGPWDASEVDDPAEGGRLDLGGVWLRGREGMQLNVEFDEAEQRVVSITAIIGNGAVQVAPFAAPKTEGIWEEVRAELGQGLLEAGGQIEERQGPFGPELAAAVPVQLPDGATGFQPVRFCGIDGPRWFLRAAFSGEAAFDADAAGPLEDVVRDIVVVRGTQPMAPRSPIELRLPDLEPGPGAPESTGPAEREPLEPFERGPEITEIR
ncbi:MAG: DUF3710 domain-containing protein [Actinomycetota bacterium]|nr:DUF3710 domain-containing protein [Actinomycetota bacterium]